MTSCTVVKNGRMNSGFWLPIVWRMPSDTATFERFSSIVAKRDAVDVEHDVGPLGVPAARP